jgi:hypothetical protein
MSLFDMHCNLMFPRVLLLLLLRRRPSFMKHHNLQVLKDLPALSDTPMQKREVC